MFPLRDENRTTQFPLVTICLIVINTLVFSYQLTLGPASDEFLLRFGAIPADILHGVRLPFSTQPPPYGTLFSSLFLHANLVHLIGNMWFLWIFGDNIEAFFGRVRFVIFYLACGLLASFSHLLLNPDSTVPIVGASGAISGVLGAYIVIYPKVRIRTLLVLGFFIDIVYIPAVFFLGFWLVLQLFGGLGGRGDVAFAAHVGGFLAGVAIVRLVSRPAPREYFSYRTAPRRIPRWGFKG